MKERVIIITEFLAATLNGWRAVLICERLWLEPNDRHASGSRHQSRTRTGGSDLSPAGCERAALFAALPRIGEGTATPVAKRLRALCTERTVLAPVAPLATPTLHVALSTAGVAVYSTSRPCSWRPRCGLRNGPPSGRFARCRVETGSQS